MAPASVVMIFMAPFLGRLTDKIGGKWILVSGLTLFAVGHGLGRADRRDALQPGRTSWPR